MSLSEGTKIGPYTVSGLIGQGGMGEVYQARDTKLDRDVALKVLPEAFTSDPDRLARFEREAKVLASLNHPNIGSIYGLEEADGVRALVLELVEGPTLADRISGGPIPLDEALPIAKQIAEALEAAHEAGVIHRDLKPANIKVREDGTVKVLDFGLAKALDPNPDADPSQSPTLTAAATQMGVIMGTAAYMSPEQARGQTVDRRADVWAFGVVLYEMVTGERTFEGATVSHVMASVLKTEPDWAALPDDTPSPITRLLRRCLEKERKQRIPDIGMARIEIDEAATTPVPALSQASRVGRPRVWQRPIPALVAAVSVVAIGGLGVWSLTQDGDTQLLPVDRFTIVVPEGVATNYGAGLALSPDGRELVFGANPGSQQQRLYRRSLGQSEVTPIPATDLPDHPFFAPDGQWIGFTTGGGSNLVKLAIAGGPQTTLCANCSPLDPSWGPDGTVVFSKLGSGLWRVSAAGGEPEQITNVDADQRDVAHRHPQLLLGGDVVLFTVWSGSVQTSEIAVQRLDTGEQRTLVGGTDPRVLPSGHLVFARENSLWAARFNLDRLKLIGAPVPVLDDLWVRQENGQALYTVSATGLLAHVPGSSEARRRLVWVDREDRPSPLIDTEEDYQLPRLSPDGTRVAVNIGGDDGEIWVCEIERATCSRLTVETGNYPLWTPDGSKVTFNSLREGITLDLYWKAADGGGEVERLLQRERAQYPISWSPDGQTLAFSELSPTGGGLDNWILPLGGDPVELTVTAFDERSPSFSPTGDWLAYRSNESGQMELYVRSYPGAGGRQRVSTEGGEEPVWSRDGRELFYRNGTELMVVSVEAGASGLRLGTPRSLFRGYDVQAAGTQNYDVSSDGQLFVMVQSDETLTPSQINITLNWFDELQRLVPSP